MPLPATNISGQLPESSLIAGSVLPIQRAEELLATLPGVISARIVAAASGAVEEIHILTTREVTPKQTVRNVESALIAHLGMHVSHKKISVATSDVDSKAPRAEAETAAPARTDAPAVPNGRELHMPVASALARRRLYFEDVEVRRSRAKGINCSVTLRKDDQTFVGEADGSDNERLRLELTARATLAAIKQAETDAPAFELEGCKVVDAFEREFVFVGIRTKQGRESVLMTGSAEVKDGVETSSVLAVLDATNRWLNK